MSDLMQSLLRVHRRHASLPLPEPKLGEEAADHLAVMASGGHTPSIHLAADCIAEHLAEGKPLPSGLRFYAWAVLHRIGNGYQPNNAFRWSKKTGKKSNTLMRRDTAVEWMIYVMADLEAVGTVKPSHRVYDAAARVSAKLKSVGPDWELSPDACRTYYHKYRGAPQFRAVRMALRLEPVVPIEFPVE